VLDVGRADGGLVHPDQERRIADQHSDQWFGLDQPTQSGFALGFEHVQAKSVAWTSVCLLRIH